jgi:hypothetical protein
MQEAARKSTVGVVSGSGQNLWRGLGTGTLVRWRDECLVLTADHVIGDTRPDDLRFFLPFDAPPIDVDRDALRTMRGLPTVLQRSFVDLRVTRIVRDPNIDLAAIVVSCSTVASNPPATFFAIPEDGATPPAGTATFTIGFPYDISRVLEDGKRIVFTHADWWPIDPSPSNLTTFDPGIHFVSRFSAADDYPDADPTGLSGSARWGRRDATPGVWHPNLDLTGVTITYYRSSRQLKMVRRESVINFLRSVAPTA